MWLLATARAQCCPRGAGRLEPAVASLQWRLAGGGSGAAQDFANRPTLELYFFDQKCVVASGLRLCRLPDYASAADQGKGGGLPPAEGEHPPTSARGHRHRPRPPSPPLATRRPSPRRQPNQSLPTPKTAQKYPPHSSKPRHPLSAPKNELALRM